MALHIQKKSVQREIKWSIAEGLPKSELTKLSFSSHNVDSLVTWKHSKEFEYKGEMFDIVQKELKGDSIHYWCWWDKEETLLNRKIEKLAYLALSGNEKSNKQKDHFFMFVKLMNLPPENGVFQIEFGRISNNPSGGQFDILVGSFEPASPPPKC